MPKPRTRPIDAEALRADLAGQIAAEVRRKLEAEREEHRREKSELLGIIEDLAGRCFDLEVSNLEVRKKLGLIAGKPPGASAGVPFKRAAGMLEVSYQRVSQMVDEGKLRLVDGLGRKRIDPESLENFKTLQAAKRANKAACRRSRAKSNFWKPRSGTS